MFHGDFERFARGLAESLRLQSVRGDWLMVWKLCLGATDHWVTGEDAEPGCGTVTGICGAHAYAIGVGGTPDRRCGRCRARLADRGVASQTLQCL